MIIIQLFINNLYCFHVINNNNNNNNSDNNNINNHNNYNIKRME